MKSNRMLLGCVSLLTLEVLAFLNDTLSSLGSSSCLFIIGLLKFLNDDEGLVRRGLFGF